MKRFARKPAVETFANEADALTHKAMATPFRLRTYKLLRKVLLGFILVSIVNAVFSYFFYTPKIYRINRDNRELVIRYRHSAKTASGRTRRRIDDIRTRDNISTVRSSEPIRSP